MANEERAVSGDGPSMRPVPLRLLNGALLQRKEKPYFDLYIKGPSWLWQTKSVPFAETAPPCEQFHFDCSLWLSYREKKTLLRLVHQETELAMANEERAVRGDGPAMRPVPL